MIVVGRLAAAMLRIVIVRGNCLAAMLRVVIVRGRCVAAICRDRLSVRDGLPTTGEE